MEIREKAIGPTDPVYLGLGGSVLCMSVAAIAAWPKATLSWCKSVTTSPAA